MIAPLKLQHIRMVGAFVVLIGAFLFASMTLIALNSGVLPTGDALKMFVAGLLAGGLIMFLGGIVFIRPSLGQRWTRR